MSEELLRELQEDIQRDKNQALMRRYGPILLGAVVAIIVGVASVSGYTHYQHTRQAEDGDALRRALIQLGDTNNPEALPALETLAKDGTDGYAGLASLYIAGSHATRGDAPKALEVYRTAAKESRYPQAIREAAAIKAAALLLSGASEEQRAEALGLLGANTKVFSATAREFSAVNALQAGEKEKAIEGLKALAADATTPQSMRNRAEELISTLSR